MAKPVYKLQIALPATRLDLLSMTEYIPPGEVVEIASECRKAGVVHLLWNQSTYLTCRDTLDVSAERA